MDDFDWVDRDRGILTERDRRYLLGEIDDELSDNDHYQKRYQIRQRIRNAMFDFHFLYNGLPYRDLVLLWPGTDDWISRARRQRRRGDAPPYPDVPLLAECWRDIISFFVYSQISTGIPESESLVKWVIEEGVNRAVRRHHFETFQMYQEVDSSLEWGTGNSYKLLDYLEAVGRQIPNQPERAEEYLRDLQRSGHLRPHHARYLFETNIEDRQNARK